MLVYLIIFGVVLLLCVACWWSCGGCPRISSAPTDTYLVGDASIIHGDRALIRHRDKYLRFTTRNQRCGSLYNDLGKPVPVITMPVGKGHGLRYADYPESTTRYLCSRHTMNVDGVAYIPSKN